MRARLLAFTASLVMAPALAHAAGRPIVVELFTSEGCSSCPPADAYLTELAGRSDVLPLAFHVTYWNALGWRDPYSLEAATSRQAEYAARLGGGSYTPEIVVDGRAGMVGSERGEVAAAITGARAMAEEEPTVQLSPAGKNVSVTLGAGHDSGRVLLVGFDPQHLTKVGRGENGGRTLRESNIVRSIRTIGRYNGTATTLSEPCGAGQSVAVLIQASDGRIIGAGRL